MKKKILVVTGGRAEYGILKPLLEEIKFSKKLRLNLVVTGTHLSNEFGYTISEIKKDKFSISDKIEIILSSDSTISIAKSMGLLMISFSETLARLKPDIVILLGDRFETFAAGSACLVSRIPICHIQGGELTKAAIDDSFRHSLTKMSYFHFVYTEEYKKRVIQLGESKKNVFNYGALNVDSIKKTKLMSLSQTYDFFNIKKKTKILLVTFHSSTLEKNTSSKQFKTILNFLKKLDDFHIIFTKTNADTDGRVINKMIDKFVKKNKNSSSYTSLGQIKYLSLLKYSYALIGNSSSGIIETPHFKKPTLNIGERQKGRLISENVINCRPNLFDLHKAFKKINSKLFKKKIKSMRDPFDKGNTSKLIIKKLEKIILPKEIKKDFIDI